MRWEYKSLMNIKHLCIKNFHFFTQSKLHKGTDRQTDRPLTVSLMWEVRGDVEWWSPSVPPLVLISETSVCLCEKGDIRCSEYEVLSPSGVFYRKACASYTTCLITSAGYQRFCSPGRVGSVCISCCNTPLCNGPRPPHTHSTGHAHTYTHSQHLLSILTLVAVALPTLTHG